MKWEHLKFEQRKQIGSMLSHGNKLVEIAKILEMDSTSISKEIRRNRIMVKKAMEKKACKHTMRFPYCCNACQLKYTTCPFNQYRYDAKIAQEMADAKLVNVRRGINIEEEDFQRVDTLIKQGLANKQSIYHIVKSNENMPTVPTIYRWIHEKKMSTNLMDLPYAVTYKKRKYKEKYNYSNNKIDRNNRTFLDFLEYRRSFPGEFSTQMDFLGSIISDSKSILTLTIPDLHFVILKLVDSPNQNKVVALFNQFEEKLGINGFKNIFPSILTDRDPSFTDYMGIEFSSETGERRTRVFYCDGYRSNQKGNVENMNKQLRKYFPKGHSIDNLTDDDVKLINNIIIESKIASLGGYTPKEAFVKVYGKHNLENLFK